MPGDSLFSFDKIFTDKFFVKVPPKDYAIKVPFKRPKKAEELKTFLATNNRGEHLDKVGKEFILHAKALILALEEWCKAHKIEVTHTHYEDGVSRLLKVDIHERLEKFNQKFLSYTGLSANTNNEYIELYRLGIPALYGIMTILQSPNLNISELFLNQIISELMKGIVECGPGVYVRLVNARDDLIGKQNFAVNLMNARRKIAEQIILNKITEEVHAGRMIVPDGMPIHYAVYITNNYANEIGVEIKKDEYQGAVERQDNEKLKQYFVKNFGTILKPETVIQVLRDVLDDSTLQSVNASPKSLISHINSLIFNISAYGNADLILFGIDDIASMDEDMTEYVKLSWKYEYVMQASLFDRLAAGGYLDRSQLEIFPLNEDESVVVQYDPNYSLKLASRNVLKTVKVLVEDDAVEMSTSDGKKELTADSEKKLIPKTIEKWTGVAFIPYFVETIANNEPDHIEVKKMLDFVQTKLTASHHQELNFAIIEFIHSYDGELLNKKLKNDSQNAAIASERLYQVFLQLAPKNISLSQLMDKLPSQIILKYLSELSENDFKAKLQTEKDYQVFVAIFSNKEGMKRIKSLEIKILRSNITLSQFLELIGNVDSDDKIPLIKHFGIDYVTKIISNYEHLNSLLNLLSPPQKSDFLIHCTSKSTWKFPLTYESFHELLAMVSDKEKPKLISKMGGSILHLLLHVHNKNQHTSKSLDEILKELKSDEERDELLLLINSDVFGRLVGSEYGEMKDAAVLYYILDNMSSAQTRFQYVTQVAKGAVDDILSSNPELFLKIVARMNLDVFRSSFISTGLGPNFIQKVMDNPNLFSSILEELPKEEIADFITGLGYDALEYIFRTSPLRQLDTVFNLILKKLTDKLSRRYDEEKLYYFLMALPEDILHQVLPNISVYSLALQNIPDPLQANFKKRYGIAFYGLFRAIDDVHTYLNAIKKEDQFNFFDDLGQLRLMSTLPRTNTGFEKNPYKFLDSLSEQAYQLVVYKFGLYEYIKTNLRSDFKSTLENFPSTKRIEVVKDLLQYQLKGKVKFSHVLDEILSVLPHDDHEEFLRHAELFSNFTDTYNLHEIFQKLNPEIRDKEILTIDEKNLIKMHSSYLPSLLKTLSLEESKYLTAYKYLSLSGNSPDSKLSLETLFLTLGTLAQSSQRTLLKQLRKESLKISVLPAIFLKDTTTIEEMLIKAQQLRQKYNMDEVLLFSSLLSVYIENRENDSEYKHLYGYLFGTPRAEKLQVAKDFRDAIDKGIDIKDYVNQLSGKDSKILKNMDLGKIYKYIITTTTIAGIKMDRLAKGGKTA